MNDHQPTREERVKELYPEYNPVAPGFKPKRKWPMKKPVKKKRPLILWGCVIFLFGFALALISSSTLLYFDKASGYTKSSNLNESYENGTRDALIAFMNFTKQTNTTYIMRDDGSPIQMTCHPTDFNLNETGGKKQDGI